jgi:hypothetical protein
VPLTPIQPVHRNAEGAAVAVLHAGLLFLIRNQPGISDNDRRTLEQGLASELRDQVYKDWTAQLVSIWQGQLADRFQVVVNGDVDQATANALNTVLAELGAPTDGSSAVKIVPFVNSYEFKGPSRFRKTIPLAAPAGAAAPSAACLAIGAEGNAGLVALIGLKGEVLWSRNYSWNIKNIITTNTLSFHDGVAADGGYVLLSVLALPTFGRAAYIVVRIDQSGNLIWARTIHTDRTRFAQRVVRSEGPVEEFLLTGWANLAPGSTQDAIELIRLKADGTVLRSAHLKMGTDDEIQNVIPTSGGYFLIGDSVRLPELAGFVINIDNALRVRSSWLLTGTGQGLQLTPTAVLELPNRLVLSGRCSPGNQAQSSMIVEVGTGAIPHVRASSFSFTDGQDQPTRIAAIGPDILVFDQPPAFARPQTVVRFNTDLVAQAHYGFDFPNGAQLQSLEVSGNNTVLIPGVDTSHPPQDHALLIATGTSLDCCKTKLLATPKLTPFPITQLNIQATVTDRPATNEAAALVVTDSVPTIRSLCGVMIDAQGEQMLQSPYLALQSAGSLGTDASRGILLRWYLAGVLASHMPKGNGAKNTLNFNKPDDFVTIYRAPWPGSAVPARQLSFAADKPTYVDDANSLLAFETGTATPRDSFYVRFLDAAAYTAARSSANPAQNMAGFLAAYGPNPIEVELRNRLAVACDIDLKPGLATYTVRVETLSVGENRPQADKILTSRRVLGPADGTTPRLVAENMRSIRIACAGAQLNAVAFRCYDDVLTYVNQAKQWMPVGRFALTDDDTTAFLRLEDPPRTQVHGHWWKFNDGAFVSVNNYKQRWQQPDGLKAAVQEYVARSELDPQATAQIVAPEQGTISISYFDLLQIAGLDYHVARMLGLAAIDNDGIAQESSYVHVAEYTTLGDLADGGGARLVQHLFMDLPTTLAQSRMPLVPDLDAVEYGLSVPTANGSPYELTDQMGYTPDGVARYIRLYPNCSYLYDAGVNANFFASPDLFDFAESSLPTLYGVEYRKAGETAWRKPEIAHDDVFADTAAVAEAMPTPFPPKMREAAFIHKETEPGIHEYAAYGIGAFYRASSLSQVRATDVTQFRKPNRLLPPSDVRVQIVQEEKPLLLTTQAEQDELDALTTSSSDPTLVRLTCNYADVQEATYGFADTIEILFRPNTPDNVIGAVTAVGVTNDPSIIRIETGPYTYLSTLETVQPSISPALKANFLGGALVAGNKRYSIVDISWPNAATGDNPIFLVGKTTSPGVTETESGPALVIDDAVPAISLQSLIMAIENMADAASWGPGNPLAATIQIGDTSWQTVAENFTNADGINVSRQLRGVWGKALVTPIGGTSNQYQIAFDNYVLTTHPQASDPNPVVWHKGVVRVPVAGRPTDDRRALSVTEVGKSSGGNLILIAEDNSGAPDHIATDSVNAVVVNYYQGYKLYLHADPAHGFDASAIMPAASESVRITIIGARSIDHTTLDVSGQPYRSPVGMPQLLSAIEIVEPRRPDKPKGLEYAAPPDTYGQSTYTLTATFAQTPSAHTPFAAAFYRADALTILRALYSAGTLKAVRAKIFPTENDAFFANRFDDIFEFLNYPSGASTFRAFPLGAGSYALPHPDSETFAGNETKPLDQIHDLIETAVMNVFLPLTEQPLIYSLIRDDSNYVPTNKKQIFRNDNGDILPPGDPEFDLAPMARRYIDNGVPTIQFADFTLDGSMNANTVYFYCVREIGNRMQIGDASPMFGPVKLVNLSPPLAPVLRKITTVPYDVLTGDNPQVRFEIVAPSGLDPIAKVYIYRATSALDATTVRTMTLVKEVDITALVPTADGTLILADDFATDPFVPYGDPLFYRLACVRVVAYRDAAGNPMTASAASEPTRILLASLLDIVNPRPPVPALSLVSITSSGDKQLRMTWDKTVHNGTYYVSRLGPSGNWMRLGSLQSNDPSVIFDLPDALPVDDEDGNLIYYRLRVEAENSSGLLNLVNAPITASLDLIE